MIQFKHTILYVADVEKSIQFYEQVFGYACKFITPEKDYGEVNSGETVISFAVHALAKTNLSEGYQESKVEGKPFGIELGFITEDVETLFAKALEHGAVKLEDPVQKPWGQTVAYAKDPDGFLLEFGTPMKTE